MDSKDAFKFLRNVVHDYMSLETNTEMKLPKLPVLKEKPLVEEKNKLEPEGMKEQGVPVTSMKTEKELKASTINLQEAIIWSEILGKPMCKRRSRRTVL